MKNILKNGTVKRTVFALLLLVIIIPAFVITAYCGTPGRIVGLVIFATLAMVGMYEVLETIGFSKPVAIGSTLIIPLFFLTPWNWTSFKAIVTREDYNTLSDFMHHAFGNWQTWLIIVLASFAPMIIDQWRKKQPNWAIQQFTAALMFIIIPLFAKTLWVINVFDWIYLFFFLPIAIISDTFAYFGGMLFGKKWFKGAKFAPKTSPKKTWAGFVVGTTFTLIFAIVAGYFMHVWKDFGSNELMVAILFGIGLSILSPYGDLLFSWFKRKANKKDYSNLIPGHGGVFDRVDAMSIVLALSGILLLFAAI